MRDGRREGVGLGVGQGAGHDLAGLVFLSEGLPDEGQRQTVLDGPAAVLVLEERRRLREIVPWVVHQREQAPRLRPRWVCLRPDGCTSCQRALRRVSSEDGDKAR